jgi:hypothetical protein
MNQPVIIVDILKAVVESMTVTSIPTVYYEAGRAIHIIKRLTEKDLSIDEKNSKYPLIAVFLPIKENFDDGHYCKAVIEKITIATLTDPMSPVLERYQDSKTFKSILYPCYYEFKRRLAMSRNVIGSDPDSFKHTKIDNPGVLPIGEGVNDYIDSIDILNLELTFSQIKTC